MKRGFTLVELSIVLVIIGLLIGGILAAQSMIETVRIQRILTNLSQYEIGINNFKSNYKFYPGDNPSFTPAGNGDNILDIGAGGGLCVGSYSNIENWQFYAHLTQAKMIDKTYVLWEPVSCPAGTMGSIFTQGGVVMPYTDLDSKASDINGRKKEIIAPIKNNAASNLRLELYVNTLQTIALEGKLGSATVAPDAVGLTNPLGAGICDGGACTDSSARAGILYYYISPL